VQQAVEDQQAQIAYIALGSNLPSGDRSPAETLQKALNYLENQSGQPIKASRVFRTPAFPPGSGPVFLNACVSINWSLSAEYLLNMLHKIEKDLGRTRQNRWEARIIDLDLIALGQTVAPDAETQALWADLPIDRAATDTPDRLILPHPRLAERSFVLVPLADIAPDWVHPLTGKSVAQMLAARPAAERAAILPCETGQIPENTG
jgi:2-amino-4-hydroxy-6-hydroxymethyldihydropteridine diphosphokinase